MVRKAFVKGGGKPLNEKNEILDYLHRRELTGAILLTGEWGCGKTYLIKQIANELNAQKAAGVAVISDSASAT